MPVCVKKEQKKGECTANPLEASLLGYFRTIDSVADFDRKWRQFLSTKITSIVAGVPSFERRRFSFRIAAGI
jgi:hypothetical protein